MSPLQVLHHEIAGCTRCSRLVAHCRAVAQSKRKAYRAEQYWGKPVPSFGDPRARLLIVGLAPGAHGANRTGRMFTGDSSGDWLYRALYEAGFASHPQSRTADDQLELNDAYITASCHCAPPDNKPLPGEILACREFLLRELKLMPQVQVVVALGRIAHDAYLNAIGVPRRATYAFAHNATHTGLNPLLIDSYHPSQQNTSTRKLTAPMLLDVFRNARSRFR